MEGKSNVAAIILAAGYSSRMGAFKPLLPLGNTTVIEQVVKTFSSAGIQDIKVVIGHQAAEVRNAVQSLAVAVIENADYASGMFSSIQAGARAIPRNVQAFFLLPVDIPLIQPQTIARLVEVFADQGVVYPCFGAERGHPPLISTKYIDSILSWQGEGGLRPLMQQWELEAVDLEVFDAGVLMDMDTPEDYQRIQEKFGRRGLPTGQECLLLLKHAGAPLPVIKHCQAVSRVAVSIGSALDKVGYNLNLHLIEAAALLHDIARDKPNHAAVGAGYLRELGYHQVAEVVNTHMELPAPLKETVTEAEVVFLSDKLIHEDTIVSLEQRFQKRRHRHSANLEITNSIENRLNQAQRVKTSVEKILGLELDKIIS